MKKPNETRFKHNFVIAAVLAIFLLATGCPNTNKPGGTDKPQGGTDIQTPNTPDQTTPETPSTEGEASGGEAGETAPGSSNAKAVKLTIKDLTVTVGGYKATNETPFNGKGKVISVTVSSDDATAKLKEKVKKTLDSLNNVTPPTHMYKLFSKTGSELTDADYADGGELAIGKQGLKVVNITLKKHSAAIDTIYEQPTDPIFTSGKVVQAVVGEGATAAEVEAALKKAVKSFIDELNASKNGTRTYYVFANVAATQTPAFGSAAASSAFKNGGSLLIAKIDKVAALKTVKLTIAKSTMSGELQLTNASNKKYIVPTDAEIPTSFYGEVTAQVPGNATAAVISEALFLAIKMKDMAIGDKVKKHDDGSIAVGDFILTLKQSSAAADAADQYIDPATKLEDGMTVYVIKRNEA